jgi:orotate phosphoribosyltransferase-like protein
MKQEIIEMPPYLNAAYEGDDLYTGNQVRELIKLVAAKEREACAKLVSDIEWKCVMDDVDDTPLKEIVKAIRARGEA